MNAFFDLMYLYYFMASICSFAFAKAILCCRIERRKTIVFSLLYGLQTPLIYLDSIFCYLGILVVTITIGIIVFRRLSLKILPLHLLFLIFLNVLNLVIYPEFLSYRSGIVIMNDSKGALSFITFPLMYGAIVIVTKAVDALYHLRKYKTYILLGNTKLKTLTAYFDSGNTLRYKNCPIIFMRPDCHTFNEDEKVEGDLASILKNSYGVSKIYKSLVRLKLNGEAYFVYVAIKDDCRSFNGCDVLLNLYLGG